jgi:hypothetical protein
MSRCGALARSRPIGRSCQRLGTTSGSATRSWPSRIPGPSFTGTAPTRASTAPRVLSSTAFCWSRSTTRGAVATSVSGRTGASSPHRERLAQARKRRRQRDLADEPSRRRRPRRCPVRPAMGTRARDHARPAHPRSAKRHLPRSVRCLGEAESQTGGARCWKASAPAVLEAPRAGASARPARAGAHGGRRACPAVSTATSPSPAPISEASRAPRSSRPSWSAARRRFRVAPSGASDLGTRLRPARCRSSRHENAPWRLCPGPAVASSDPRQGLCWENAGG